MIQNPFRRPTWLLFLIVIGMRPATAEAGVTTYSDYASWSGSVSGITSVTIPAEGIFLGAGDASVTYDQLTFSTSSTIGNGLFFNVISSSPDEPPVLSSQQATVGLANILITLPTAVTALSLNFGTFDGSAVTFTLSDGYTATLGTTGSGYQTPYFFGITDTTSFSSVLITSGDFVLNVNEVSFGSAVPEPPSLALSLSAVAGGLAVHARRRRHAA